MAGSSEIERLVGLLVKDQGSHGEEQQSVVTYCQDISPVIQKGPMCGLVGLTMAAQLLLKGIAKPHHTTEGIHPENILEYAAQNGLSKRGEMFSTSSMKKIIVDHLHLQAQVVMTESHNALQELVIQTVSGEKAVLVPYDADKNHTPCLAQGHCAHWCLLVGVCLVVRSNEMDAPLTQKLLEFCQRTSNNAHYVVGETGAEEFIKLLKKTFDQKNLKESLDDNLIYVFTRHGKTSHLGLWSLRDLIRSNGNLVEVDPRRSDPMEYVIPKGGLEEGLRNKFLFVAK